MDLSQFYFPTAFGFHLSNYLWVAQMIDSDDVDDFLVTFMQPPKTARGWAGLEGKRICRRFMGGITNSIWVNYG